MRHHLSMAVMRTKARTEVHELGYVILFREDLEDIAKAVAELGPLTITCDDTYTATGPDDFVELPASPSSLIYMAAADGRQIDVELSRRVARVVLTEPDTLCQGILGRINAVIARPRRRPWLLTLNRMIAFAYAVATALTSVAVYLAPDEWGKPWDRWSAFAIAAFVTAFTSVLIFPRLMKRDPPRSARLVNAYQSDRPTFWRRTRDDWVVEIIVGLVFLVLGFVLGKVTS